MNVLLGRMKRCYIEEEKELIKYNVNLNICLYGGVYFFCYLGVWGRNFVCIGEFSFSLGNIKLVWVSVLWEGFIVFLVMKIEVNGMRMVFGSWKGKWGVYLKFMEEIYFFIIFWFYCSEFYVDRKF